MKTGKKCGICQKELLPHEVALFHSGKGNLVQLHTGDGIVLIHWACAEPYETTSELLQAVTGGRQNLDYLES